MRDIQNIIIENFLSNKENSLNIENYKKNILVKNIELKNSKYLRTLKKLNSLCFDNISTKEKKVVIAIDLCDNFLLDVNLINCKGLGFDFFNNKEKETNINKLIIKNSNLEKLYFFYMFLGSELIIQNSIINRLEVKSFQNPIEFKYSIRNSKIMDEFNTIEFDNDGNISYKIEEINTSNDLNEGYFVVGKKEDLIKISYDVKDLALTSELKIYPKKFIPKEFYYKNGKIQNNNKKYLKISENFQVALERDKEIYLKEDIFLSNNYPEFRII